MATTTTPSTLTNEERRQEAYRLRQQMTPDGENRWTWAEIAEKVGYPSIEAAQMAAHRYKKRLLRGDDGPWCQYLPWQVRRDDMQHYVFQRLVFLLKQREGVRLAAGERSQLQMFCEKMDELDSLIVYDVEPGLGWGRRQRRLEDQGAYFARE